MRAITQATHTVMLPMVPSPLCGACSVLQCCCCSLSSKWLPAAATCVLGTDKRVLSDCYDALEAMLCHCASWVSFAA